MKARKIAVVSSTRAEYGLLYWLLKEIQGDPELELQLIATGSHLSADHGFTYRDIEADGFKIHRKVEILSSEDSGRGMAHTLATAVSKFSDVFSDLKPDLVVVTADRYEMLGIAEAAFLLGIPIAHIFGGEATEGALDESVRHALTKLSHFHFATTDAYRTRILQLGENPQNVFNFGSLSVENIVRSKLLSKEGVEKNIGFKFRATNFLVTYHPVTTLGETPDRAISALFEALDRFPDAGVIVTKPNIDAGGRRIMELMEQHASINPDRVLLKASLGRINYLSTIQYVDAVIGNSSSGILEVPTFKKASINLGVRQQGRLRAESVIDCPEEAGAIERAIQKVLSAEFKEKLRTIKSPYEQANTSERIKDTLKTVNLHGVQMKKFFDWPAVEPKKVYIIAEAGVNHNGSLDLAKQLIDVAADSGADAVKFQTFKAEKLVSAKAPKAEYQKETTGTDESQHEMLKKLELSDEAHRELIEHAKQKGIQFLSTAFDLESLDLLSGHFNLPKIKIPSGEITNAQLIFAAARTLKPILLSTGMSTLEDIKKALSVLAFGFTNSQGQPSLAGFEGAYQSEAGQRALKEKVTILQCTTAYPAPATDAHLLAMDEIKSAFGLAVGYSDHTEGITAPIVAVARGATVIEKHFTISRDLPGPDHRASLEPGELKEMVRAIRETEMLLGKPHKAPTGSELANRPIARKSLVAARDIRAGEAFTEENLTSVRPDTGVSAIHFYDFLGRAADRDFKQGELIQ